MEKTQKSFLKWPGGKGRIIDKLLPHFPEDCQFIEPFVGAGNVFINVSAKSYILADSNQDLINTYSWLKDDLVALYNATKELFNTENDFYDIRNQFNQPKFRWSLKLAAQFIYLNRHGFNGICRYNKNGQFNVPKGNHKNIYFPEAELVNFNGKLLFSDTTLLHCDFTKTIELAAAGSVVYCDPPYLTKHRDSFVGYTPSGFCYSDTELLAHCLHDAVSRGAIAIVSNCDNSSTRDIFHRFQIHEIDAPRSVAANGNRKPAREIIAVLTPDMI
ncbi:Dam family site-specific DNA-(adenine-N6)-methyltransferase [Gilliamella sp. B2865]|uniref:DNA adenine methylase n=1 Tax=Gilliamella sp. B2865 TaxID=2817984 RepID=UPI00226A4A74|nr:Dam family site-specific DNA-(adenine-N6)-methyltransferase [Gilliamella sp. B2865]MCX8678592.1 Dam family site-specific DNA-(adenine-N6)-methyltransferase [Gilliamella sp. B2865]